MLVNVSLMGQSGVIRGTVVNQDDFSELWEKFEHFELYKIDSDKVNDLLAEDSEHLNIHLKLGSYDWNMSLYPHDIRSDSYTALTQINGQTVEIEKLPNITYRGELKGIQGSDVRMGVMTDMLLGTVTVAGEEYFIENLDNLVAGAPQDVYIVYNTSSVIPDPNTTCGMDRVHHMQDLHDKDHDHGQDHSEEIQGEGSEEAVALACYEVVTALACDVAFTSANGGPGGAQGRMIAILNLVQTNYDDEFLHEIQFLLGPTFIPTSSNPGSWNFGSIGSLLSSFRNWGNGGGFGSTSYTVATMWTNRSYGGVIGLAYLTALCSGNRYNICVNYTSNTNGLRNLQAHELGHNFSFTHDPSGSPHIMAPAVNGSNTWSGQSQSQFASRVPFSCMGPCSGGVPPVADFSATPIQGCRPMIVQFTDLSSNTPTQWRWTFPGGSPATSSSPNPRITYNVPGRYDVILEATNAAGTGIEQRRSYIEVGDMPIANFDANIVLDEVIFVDRSIVYGTGSYFWDFGDGNFSNDSNPVHEYENDGIYLVTLTIETNCGISTFQRSVEIVTPPTAMFTAIPTEGCVGSVVEFLNESSDNVLSYRWDFEAGNPRTATIENPIVKYDTAGVFEVTLVVTNSRYQDVERRVGYITIDSSSVADFDAVVDTLEVQFDNMSSHGREYEWHFGDGSTSRQMDPMHIYPEDSIYEVTLITTNFCDEDTIVKNITVGVLPTAAFMADTQIACVNSMIQFEDMSSDNTKRILWQFEGGSPATSTDANPTVLYEQTGTFNVTLIATNALGRDTLEEQMYITIEDVPESGFSFTRNGFEITFINESTSATSYSWDFGDGNTSTDEAPVHTYQQDGDYNVILVATSACGVDTIEQVVSISNFPNANFSADQTDGCVPFTVNLQNLSSTNAESYEWSIPGGSPSTSTDENPVVSFNNPGLYRVTLVAKNAFGNDTLVRLDYIDVLDVPEADFNFTLNGFTVDFEETAEYAAEYEWDFGDGGMSNMASPSHTYNDEGEYDVILIVRNRCGADTMMQTILVTPRPVVGFSQDVNSICIGEEIQYTDQTGNNPTSWEWQFEGGDPSTSTDQNPLVRYDAPGVYDVILSATNQFGTNVDTFQQVVEAFDDPYAEFTSIPRGISVEFVNNSDQFGNINWDFGDGSNSTEFEPVHRFPRPGTYVVELSVENPCGVDTYSQEVFVRYLDVDFPIISPPPSPNPSNGFVSVTHIGEPADEITIFVSGIDGQLQEVLSSSFHKGQMTADLDLSDLAPGTYLMFFKTDKETRMTKIVIQE
jgi:PKD repeat protein